MAVVYMKHPVTPEQKAEQRAKGNRIIDIKFAPPEAKEEAKEEPKPKRKRRTKAEMMQAESDESNDSAD